MKILMLENHELFVRNVVDTFLQEHSVTVVPSILHAKSEWSGSLFDLVLVDYDLDDGKGDEFVRWVTDQEAAVPIVAISSHEYGNEMLRTAGADAICSKMDFRDIADVVEELRNSGD